VAQGFAELYGELVSDRAFSADDAAAFGMRAQAWAARFVDLHGPKKMTPYVHALAAHVAPQLARHGSLRLYSCSAAEQRHYVDKMVLFRNCRFGQKWCTSLLRREHRRLLARSLGLDRVPRRKRRKCEPDLAAAEEAVGATWEDLGLASSSARGSDSA